MALEGVLEFICLEKKWICKKFMAYLDTYTTNVPDHD